MAARPSAGGHRHAEVLRWMGVGIDCADAGPVARFYRRLLGFEMHEFQPPNWAQLWDPAGGVHVNLQGDTRYESPTWPEQPGEQAKMLHFEIEVEDLEAAVATAVAASGRQRRAPSWPPLDEAARPLVEERQLLTRAP